MLENFKPFCLKIYDELLMNSYVFRWKTEFDSTNSNRSLGDEKSQSRVHISDWQIIRKRNECFWRSTPQIHILFPNVLICNKHYYSFCNIFFDEEKMYLLQHCLLKIAITKNKEPTKVPIQNSPIQISVQSLALS